MRHILLAALLFMTGKAVGQSVAFSPSAPTSKDSFSVIATYPVGVHLASHSHAVNLQSHVVYVYFGFYADTDSPGTSHSVSETIDPLPPGTYLVTVISYVPSQELGIGPPSTITVTEAPTPVFMNSASSLVTLMLFILCAAARRLGFNPQALRSEHEPARTFCN
jgi:hypothetical protein